MKYIAFLRGINVGGHNLKMEQLRELFGELGLEDIRTFIQSGNVGFETNDAADELLETKIEKHLLKRLGYEVPTYVRSLPELKETIAKAPFVDDPPANVRQLVNFTKSSDQPARPFPLTSAKGDSAIIGRHGREVYVRWQILNGRPPDTNKFFKDVFGSVSAAGTGRFYHTLKKLMAWAQQ